MRKMITALSIVLCYGLAAFAQTPSPVRADNVRSTPPNGGVIQVTYDLVAPAGTAAAITLEASDDGGRTWNIKPRSVTGDVGDNVTSGVGKRIVWEAGKDVETVRPDQFQFRISIAPIVASETRPAPPDQPHPREPIDVSVPQHPGGPSPQFEMAGGYMYLNRPFFFTDDRSMPGGWFASFGVTLSKVFGVVSQLSGSRRTDVNGNETLTLSSVTFGVGPRFSAHAHTNERMTPFLEILVGSAHLSKRSLFGPFLDSSSSNDLSGSVAGGADFTVSRCCDVRAQFAYTRIKDSPDREYRFMLGGVFRTRSR